MILGQRNPDQTTGLDARRKLLCARAAGADRALCRPFRSDRRAIVAWNGSREAARGAGCAATAVDDGFGYCPVGQSGGGCDIEAADALVAHLARHGLNAGKLVVREEILGGLRYGAGAGGRARRRSFGYGRLRPLSAARDGVGWRHPRRIAKHERSGIDGALSGAAGSGAADGRDSHRRRNDRFRLLRSPRDR